MGTQLPLSKGHISPHNKLTYLLTYFWAHVYCGQTSGCIRIPLGTEVGLGQGNIVLDVDPASPHGKGHCSPPPIFRPMSIVAKRSPISATAELLFFLDTILLGLAYSKCDLANDLQYYKTVSRNVNKFFPIPNIM